MEFLLELKNRNDLLFWFGLINLLAALLFIIIAVLKPVSFAGTNAWYKPIKFAISTAILVFSIGWYTGHLPTGKNITIASWIIIITLAFEVTYIAWQASKGQASHFNQSSSFYAFMFSMMALAATVATIAVGYIGIHFFAYSMDNLPNYYLWAIRFGFILFVVFAFEGFVMGANLSHTIGAVDGGKGLPFLNWSRKFGDPRVAHFIGMHALQVLPILAYYILKDIKLTIFISVLYTLLAVYVLIQALQAKPFLKFIN